MSKQKKSRNSAPKRKHAPKAKPAGGIAKRPTGPERTKADTPKGPPWLYGRHAVIAALQNPKRNCLRLILSEDFRKTHGQELQEALDATERNRPEPELRSRQEIEEITGGGVHQGIALQADPLPRLNIEDILPDLAEQSHSVIVALDQATDPQNIGAILRSAAAFGASAVIIPDKNAPEVTASMAKAACGAVERLPFIRITNLSRTLDQLKEEGFWSVGLDGYAQNTLSKIDLKGKTVLVMGSEGSGLRRLTREKCDFLAKIPISQAVESLNLSNATAVSLYEIARQQEG